MTDEALKLCAWTFEIIVKFHSIQVELMCRSVVHFCPSFGWVQLFVFMPSSWIKKPGNAIFKLKQVLHKFFCHVCLCVYNVHVPVGGLGGGLGLVLMRNPFDVNCCFKPSMSSTTITSCHIFRISISTLSSEYTNSPFGVLYTESRSMEKWIDCTPYSSYLTLSSIGPVRMKKICDQIIFSY